MDPLALILRTAVAAVLAAAAVAKLKDLEGSREAMRGFGVPGNLAPAAGLALPLVELAGAATLAAPALARGGAVLAAALFVTMSAAIGRLLVLGQAPDCHCFGRLQSEPVGAGTLVRSLGLALAAAVVAVHGGGSSLAELGPVGAEAALPLTAAGVALALSRRAARRPRLYPDSLLPGAPAPAFKLPHPGGGEASLDAFVARGRPTALLFVEPGCGPCRALLSDLGSWRAALADDLNLAVLVKGGRDESRAVGEHHGLDDLIVDEQGSTLAAYGVRATPTAVLIGTDGRIARAPTGGKDGIEALLRITLQGAPPPIDSDHPPR